MNSPNRPPPTAAELVHHYTHVQATVAAIRQTLPNRRTKENARVIDAVDNNIVNLSKLMDVLISKELADQTPRAN